MKQIVIVLFTVVSMHFTANAQEVKAATVKQFMQVTTIESVISGGIGRSRMIITNADGSQKETDMENLFSLTGINFKNIKQNEDKILSTLKIYTEDGWTIDQITSLTLSPNDTGSGGIFMTRYLMSKSTEKK
jgi:hypothetical protein